MKALFVTGLPRSGTSFLASCIHWHPDVGPQFDPMSEYRNAGDWVAGIYKHRYTQFIENNAEWSGWLPGAGVFGKREPTLHEHARPGMADAMTEGNPHPVYLSKSPSHLWRIGALREAFPGARFVVMLRQPQEILGSIYEKQNHLCPYPLTSPEGLRWFSNRYNRALERMAEQRRDDFHFVRYEDLCFDVPAALGAVLRHCELAPRHYIYDIKSRSVPEAWRSRVPAEHHTAVLDMAGPLSEATMGMVEYSFARKVPPPNFWVREITNEAASLLPHIPKDKPCLGAEVGVLMAKTASILLHRRPLLRLALVDSWATFPEHKAVAERNLKEVASKGRYLIHHGDSTAMAEEVPDGSLDYVFIDASKREDKYRSDVLAWLPKVKPGGFIQGHDWHMSNVPKVVGEIADYLILPFTVNEQRDTWMIRL